MKGTVKRFMRKLLSVIAAATLMITLGSCDENTINNVTGGDYPVTVWGVEIAKCPQKVISLSPSVTDVIYTLGSDAQLCGVSENCNNSRGLATYGSSAMPDVDKIIASDAEYVLTDGSMPDSARKLLADEKKTLIITPVVTDYSELETFYESVASIFSGYSTGKSNAENTFARINERVQSVRKKVGDKAADAVILLDAGIAAAKGTFADQMLTFAGGKNAAGDQYAMDFTAVAKADPEYIFCPADMVDTVKNDKILASTKAVKSGNVTALSPLYFERYGENIALGVEIMASAMHPDAVKSPLK